MLVAAALFVLVNIACFCAVPKDLIGTQEAPDMATVFLSQVFGDKTAPRVMSALIPFSLLGNITVMPFTAARVKQEIAKEGILPFSLPFAAEHTTPWAWLKNR
jgi:amino acid transporter